MSPYIRKAIAELQKDMADNPGADREIAYIVANEILDVASDFGLDIADFVDGITDALGEV